MPAKLLRIGELAAELGTTSKTIRFYEKVGLLDEPTRSAKGYRLYDRRAVANARLVLGLRRLGLGIEALKELCGPGQGHLRRQLLSIMDEKIREMDETLAVLQGRRDDLAARHQALLSTPRGKTPRCVCAALLSPCTCADQPESAG